MVRYPRQEQLGEQHVSSQRQRRVEPSEREGQSRVSHSSSLDETSFCLLFNSSLCVLVWGRSLNVQGRRAALLQSSSEPLDGLPGTSSGSHSQHMQRVIEVEGLMEEYLAFDSRDL